MYLAKVRACDCPWSLPGNLRQGVMSTFREAQNSQHLDLLIHERDRQGLFFSPGRKAQCILVLGQFAVNSVEGRGLRSSPANSSDAAGVHVVLVWEASASRPRVIIGRSFVPQCFPCKFGLGCATKVAHPRCTQCVSSLYKSSRSCSEEAAPHGFPSAVESEAW